MTIVPGVITFLLYYEQLKTMIIQNLGDGNSNKQTGQHLKHFALFNFNEHSFESDDPVTDFSNILLEIADKTIPKSSISSKPRKPWFDDECKQAIKERKNSEKAFRRSPCHSKLSSFRIHRAKARRTIKQKKRASWKQFVSSINNRTPMNKIWNMINRIKGRKNSATVKHLTVNNNLITDKLDIAK